MDYDFVAPQYEIKLGDRCSVSVREPTLKKAIDTAISLGAHFGEFVQVKKVDCVLFTRNFPKTDNKFFWEKKALLS